MGVQGLWSILEPTGKVISVETLENQILAIDISLWLHQSVKGFRNPGADGVAHILGLFHRLCKLLFYGIRPVFVFDGRNIPQLKKETLLKRRLRTKSSKEKVAESLRTKALLGHLMTQVSQVQSQASSSTLVMQKVLKHGQKGLSSLLSRRTGSAQNPNNNDKDLYELAPLPSRSGILENEDSDIDEEILNFKFSKSASSVAVDDIHDVDIEGSSFQSLPKDQQYNVLIEMKEKRKMNSWAKIDSMPKNAQNFSSFQMQRLLKRANIQKTMEKVEKDLIHKEIDLIDPHLFVGDKKGIKAMRLASDSKKSILFGSRQSGNEDSKTIQPKKVLKNEPEQSTSKDEPNNCQPKYSEEQTRDALLQLVEENTEMTIKSESDEDILTQEALLQSISSKSSVGVNEEVMEAQTALLQMIKDENEVMSEEIIDEDLVILAPTLTHNCNQRHGGKIVDKVKTEEDPIPGPSSSYSSRAEKTYDNECEVGVMSSSSEESDDDSHSVKNNDIFADVFKDEQNFEELDKILSQKSTKPLMLRKTFRKRSVSSSSESSNSYLKTDTDDKIQSTQSSSKQNDLHDNEDSSKSNDVIKEISNTMKNSDHLWLKIASKYVPVVEDSAKNEDPKEVIEKETISMTESLLKENDMLIREMKNSDRESRLLQYQNVDYTPDDSPSKKDESEELIFGSSAPGFVRSGNLTNIQEVEIEAQTPEALFQQESAVVSIGKDENSLDVRDLMNLQKKLAAERETIIAEASRQERLAASITDQMYQECQELLQIFGIPYVVAPGEAEAQCAYLEKINLTNGTVTDDSDVWVFGSRKVYKNFFEREKFVEFFSLSDIEAKLGLSQGKMISIAMLTGSDYTEGIYNVGPITALEILAEFPGEELEPLNEFKKWLNKNKESGFGEPVSRVRENFKRLSLIEGFPSQAVLEAYKKPLVDTSDERFTWAIPNFVAIRDYATEKFGFTYSKVDEMLGPIVKRIRAKSLQTRIDNYFVNHSLLPRNQKEMTSKRGLSAIQRVKGKADSPKKKSRSKDEAKETVSKKKLLTKEEKNELAKKRALEIMKRDTRQNKRPKRPKRVTLVEHNLSEESDDSGA